MWSSTWYPDEVTIPSLWRCEWSPSWPAAPAWWSQPGPPSCSSSGCPQPRSPGSSWSRRTGSGRRRNMEPKNWTFLHNISLRLWSKPTWTLTALVNVEGITWPSRIVFFSTAAEAAIFKTPAEFAILLFHKSIGTKCSLNIIFFSEIINSILQISATSTLRCNSSSCRPWRRWGRSSWCACRGWPPPPCCPSSPC